MTFLSEGSTGEQVLDLQAALIDRGLDIGEIDGDFGPRTVAAVRVFQEGEGLEANGVAGPETFAALRSQPPALASASAAGSVTARVTPEIVSRMFPGARVSNITRHLPLVLGALDRLALGDRGMVLTALGTIRAETAGFVPISEGISRFNTSAGSHPFNLYDNRADLGNRGRPDGATFKGRGFVQLTGRDNYTRLSAQIGRGNDLVTNPELANDPRVAADLLARFLKNKEAGIRRALANDDLRTARRLVNGGSHGLHEFTEAFRTGERLIN